MAPVSKVLYIQVHEAHRVEDLAANLSYPELQGDGICSLKLLSRKGNRLRPFLAFNCLLVSKLQLPGETPYAAASIQKFSGLPGSSLIAPAY